MRCFLAAVCVGRRIAIRTGSGQTRDLVFGQSSSILSPAIIRRSPQHHAQVLSKSQHFGRFPARWITMVILAAAALGAAGYGAYKGGEAAVKKGSELKTEHQRNQKRREQTSEFKQKTGSRQERIAKLMSMRNAEPSTSSSSSFSSSEKSDSQRQKDVIASFRARCQEPNKGGGLKNLLKRGGK